MTIRIATFNVENLFRRPHVFALDDAAERQRILEDFALLVSLLDHETYTDEDKETVVGILERHDAADSQSRDRPIVVNQTRGGAKLFKAGQGGGIEITAKGRAHWVGWAELVRDDVNGEALQNTGRVIAEVDADILLAVEVEDRLTLERFNNQVLAGRMGEKRYPFNMLIDGNDSRGIDIGLLSRRPVTSVRSHIFDGAPGRPPVFSRDCPEFEVELGDGQPLWVLGNHFKSKGFGAPAVSAKKREAQARRVKEIYEDALRRTPLVTVAGDLNDSPDSEPIGLLLDTGLRDAMSHSGYTGPPGTYGTGNSLRQKIDYLMFSPDLFEAVRAVEVERRGIWAPDTFDSFPTVTSKTTQASDHAALYADLDV
ncbi:endonuclease/exonuclease/phosphatase family protein [Streptomyces sp. NPDC006134]|uniref:endonuclease/exonuclease/phosphatase family protein n=1 Tax=Streptomyces sp. NPDC006134 TaxID=3154467 RepID=UPI0033E21302